MPTTRVASAVDLPRLPVDRLNKFVIDDVVRGRELTLVPRLRAMAVPRPT